MSKLPTYRIVSNGLPNGTKVFLPNGEEMPNVKEVAWHIGFDRIGVAVITVVGCEGEVEALKFENPTDESDP